MSVDADYVRIRLSIGAEHPYDASDNWRENDETAPPPPVDWAHAAARGIVADLSDRRDIKRGFEGVDESVRAEIIETMAAIIRATVP